MAEGDRPGDDEAGHAGSADGGAAGGEADPLAADIRSYVQQSLGTAYTIERELGGGGMSRVFTALDHALDRKVVVKVLPPELAAALSLERFKREAVSIMKDVARALAYAHNRGVIHRDIKPDNIIISGATATVTDFGVAKAVAASRAGPLRDGAIEARTPGGSTITHAGVSLGTPTDMAPEQAA